MPTVQFARPNPALWGCDTPPSELLEVIHVFVPFGPSVSILLPEVDGRAQWSVRQDTGQEIELIDHESLGWTVEYHARIACDWADVWVTETYRKKVPIEYGEGGKLWIEAEEREFPAMNLHMQDAMRIAVERREWTKNVEIKSIIPISTREKEIIRKRALRDFQFGFTRLRHQHSGNIIMADIL